MTSAVSRSGALPLMLVVFLVLLDYGKSPAERAGASSFIMAIGGVLAVIGGAGSILRLR
jgi:hypothetical protein